MILRRESKIGLITLVLSIGLLFYVEYNAFLRSQPFETKINKEEAEQKVIKQYGKTAQINFERDLEKKYYFKVYDQRKRKWIDVYVDKNSSQIQTYKD